MCVVWQRLCFAASCVSRMVVLVVNALRVVLFVCVLCFCCRQAVVHAHTCVGWDTLLCIQVCGLTCCWCGDSLVWGSFGLNLYRRWNSVAWASSPCLRAPLVHSRVEGACLEQGLHAHSVLYYYYGLYWVCMCQATAVDLDSLGWMVGRT